MATANPVSIQPKKHCDVLVENFAPGALKTH